MKIGLVGFGYWGKIILKNLESLGYKDITLCDISFKNNKIQNYNALNDYKKLDCDNIFITTPTETHFEICKYFLERNAKVFCEKPLTTSSSKAETLYSLAFKNKTIIFTDWIFLFNNQVETIKKDYESGKLGKIKSIYMNRLNLGPERFDVSARWDLASHDVSIIQYLFSEFPINIKWMDYKKNKNSKQMDSCIGLLFYNDFTATINVSWQYRKKVRECVFEFDNSFVVWDDFKRLLQYEDASTVSFPIYSGNLSYPCAEYLSPLHNSIKTFFSFKEEDMKKQKELTINTIKILEV